MIRATFQLQPGLTAAELWEEHRPDWYRSSPPDKLVENVDRAFSFDDIEAKTATGSGTGTGTGIRIVSSVNAGMRVLNIYDERSREQRDMEPLSVPDVHLEGKEWGSSRSRIPDSAANRAILGIWLGCMARDGLPRPSPIPIPESKDKDKDKKDSKQVYWLELWREQEVKERAPVGGSRGDQRSAGPLAGWPAAPPAELEPSHPSFPIEVRLQILSSKTCAYLLRGPPTDWMHYVKLAAPYFMSSHQLMMLTSQSPFQLSAVRAHPAFPDWPVALIASPFTEQLLARLARMAACLRRNRAAFAIPTSLGAGAGEGASVGGSLSRCLLPYSSRHCFLEKMDPATWHMNMEGALNKSKLQLAMAKATNSLVPGRIRVQTTPLNAEARASLEARLAAAAADAAAAAAGTSKRKRTAFEADQADIAEPSRVLHFTLLPEKRHTLGGYSQWALLVEMQDPPKPTQLITMETSRWLTKALRFDAADSPCPSSHRPALSLFVALLEMQLLAHTSRAAHGDSSAAMLPIDTVLQSFLIRAAEILESIRGSSAPSSLVPPITPRPGSSLNR